MSLHFINSLTHKQAISLFNTICENADLSTFLYGRAICEDYSDLLIAPSNMSIMQYLTEELEVRIGEYLSSGLSEQEFEEFDGINDVEVASGWLKQHCPNYREIVNQCLAVFLDYYLNNKLHCPV